jgi:ribosomal protein L35
MERFLPNVQQLTTPFQQLMSCTFHRWKHTLKTNKSVAKRFRVRGGSGHKKTVLTHMRSGAQHNTGYRGRGAINKLGQSKPVSNKKMERKMKICLGVL